MKEYLMGKQEEKGLKQAAALQYSLDKDKAPKIIALGQGVIAEKIIETAEGNDIPTYVDPALAKTLSTLQIGDEIPPQLYEVVAKILIFVNHLDQTYGKK